MSAPGTFSEFAGRMAYEFTLLQPYIPTYLHLLVSALFLIFTGAHASLSRPSSAARPSKTKNKSTDGSEEEDYMAVETSQRMERFSPSDAILYPVLIGSMLAGLYFLIKWLQDPEILNKILNWYLSVFGLLSIATLLTDSTSTVMSFIFPARYSDGGMVWEVKRYNRSAVPRSSGLQNTKSLQSRDSPLPGRLSRLSFSPKLVDLLWTLRDIPTQPLLILETYIRGIAEGDLPLGLVRITSVLSALIAVLYFNLVDKPWWLTNLLGFAFSYTAIQLMSPTTFWTGTLVLTSLFFYDIYFVFFTPLMITVATKLDIPVKLLFPRPPGADDDPSKKALAMLGLGDIVIPGIMIGLALRFDLYLFYLRKQKRRRSSKADLIGNEVDKTNVSEVKSITGDENVFKADYRPATAGWGERFWLDPYMHGEFEGGAFPKIYFYASVIGYIIGILCTLGVMHVYKHGQPALLYLVPGVLVSLWGTALTRGELKNMWEYTEAEDENEEPEKSNENKNQKAGPLLVDSGLDPKDVVKATPPGLESDARSAGIAKKSETEDDSKEKGEANRRLFMFSISLPNTKAIQSLRKNATRKVKQAPTLAEELLRASNEKLVGSEPSDVSGSSNESSPSGGKLDGINGEPPGKRQRVE